jgi:two-component system response regulator FlrC
VLTQATQVAATDTTLLLLGESGTGKEVIARFLHRASPRRDGPFIALNCAALPEQLLEAELFGYERGAFTGATQSKPGQLEQAGGGTLFLDEVGEMSPPAQAKFLRVLQERSSSGSAARACCAPARALSRRQSRSAPRDGAGRVREDLFYRLNVFAVHLPLHRSARGHPADQRRVPLGDRPRARPRRQTRQTRKRLMDYHWPGTSASSATFSSARRFSAKAV